MGLIAAASAPVRPSPISMAVASPYFSSSLRMIDLSERVSAAQAVRSRRESRVNHDGRSCGQPFGFRRGVGLAACDRRRYAILVERLAGPPRPAEQVPTGI